MKSDKTNDLGYMVELPTRLAECISIVVTPEMVAAGLTALWPCVLKSYQDEEEVMRRVYIAMAKLEP